MASSRRLLLGTFGDPGHTFPLIALGVELVARGHDVTLQTWKRWRPEVEATGMRFAEAPEYPVWEQGRAPMKPYEAVVHAARDTLDLIEELNPEAAVCDILSLAPAMAAEMRGVPVATVIPHVHPDLPSGFPPYASGARAARTRVGRQIWRCFDPLVERGVRRGQGELNETRRRLALAPLDRLHGGLSDELCMVATFPSLEYPRAWPSTTHVVGPLMWEPPFGDVELPPGDDPLVLVAPSTVKDEDHRLLRAALAGLADEPVRVLATWNRRPLLQPVEVPANARLVEWVSYSRTMPHCEVVICNGGHGTVVRALASGCRVVVSPAGGDMGENGARVAWAGLGTRVPSRLLSPRTIALAVRQALADDGMRERVDSVARWAGVHDGANAAAELIEEFAASHA